MNEHMSNLQLDIDEAVGAFKTRINQIANNYAKHALDGALDGGSNGAKSSKGNGHSNGHSSAAVVSSTCGDRSSMAPHSR